MPVGRNNFSNSVYCIVSVCPSFAHAIHHTKKLPMSISFHLSLGGGGGCEGLVWFGRLAGPPSVTARLEKLEKSEGNHSCPLLHTEEKQKRKNLLNVHSSAFQFNLPLVLCSTSSQFCISSLFSLFAVPQVHYSACSLFHMFPTLLVRCSTCSLFRLFTVPRVHYIAFSLFHMFTVQRFRCFTCSLFRVFAVLCAHCSASSLFHVFKFRSVIPEAKIGIKKTTNKTTKLQNEVHFDNIHCPKSNPNFRDIT